MRQYFLYSHHLEPFITLLYAYDFAENVVFNENSSNERFYHHSSANSLKPNLGLAYNLNSYKDADQILFWFCVGYNFRLSKYYIDQAAPVTTTNTGETNKLKRKIFNNAAYCNIGITNKRRRNRH